ncbi:MAG: diguanylate cyclase domain-containing protein [Actinomycetota bacterium]
MTENNEPSGEQPLVLVVDDDPDLLRLAEVQLRADFSLILADNGADCIEIARSRNPDVIVLDMMMPQMDGLAVLEILNEDSTTADIPVICLSALSRVDDKLKGLYGGAIDYMTKPADQRELVARIWSAIRRRRKEAEALQRSSVDPITALPGRSAFDVRLNEEIARSKRTSAPFSVLIIDVDEMGAINEQIGREQADRLLGRLARVVKSSLRASDLLFRYDGDEFSALLPESDAGTAWIAAERIRSAVKEIESDAVLTSVSVGISEYSRNKTPGELMSKAEIALFKAKESGGNMSWRSDDPRKHSLSTLSLSEELTLREWDVLAHLAQRRTEHEIAEILGISSGTVRSHKARIRRKLHIPPDVRLADFVRDNFKDLSERGSGAVGYGLGESRLEPAPIGRRDLRPGDDQRKPT